ncbi:MAG: alpha-rhamnosidase [Provencibacterium sp.]|nr:alpha-rhamnosidase [Provencibacterium sp.]
MSQWIWKFGELEHYHSLLVHSTRQNYGYIEPVIWKQYACDPVIAFRKVVELEQEGTITIHACGDFTVTVAHDTLRPWEGADSIPYWGQKVVPLKAGRQIITVRVSNPHTFPCLYIEGAVETDGSWLADDQSGSWSPAGTSPMFTDSAHTPETFPFRYEELEALEKEPVNGGILLDFGKETYCRTEFSNLKAAQVRIQYGESREEALDGENCVIRFEGKPKEGRLSYRPSAFRYIFVSDPNAQVKADYEYLPLEYRGAFSCDEPLINRVWEVSAYTFHLNCREFFLDGIKRDHWVWSGDTYQSLFVNRYLFFDKDIEQRTLIMLGGKTPFSMHVNMIMDYTFFWVISLYEHYMTYGDRAFLEQIAPQLEEVMRFCTGREEADGFMRGKGVDWVFIDWADMDKTGALCGEQVLWAKALECYSRLCAFLGRPDGGAAKKAERLQSLILEKFYDAEKKAFIDSFESGRRNVTRHSNILAYLFLPCSEQMKADIYRHVILNDAVPQITTPYFKFYENQVHCEAGNTALLEQSLRDYYGGMLRFGATSFFEEFDPTLSGVQHYAMYGRPYEKSLCHAWSASPVYLLGAYRLGVRNTGVAYESFDVRPQLGDLKSFSGKVPVPGGAVRVEMDAAHIRVLSDIPGGTLRINGQTYKLKAGEEKIINCPAKML